jgi:hypothetical protein
MLAFVDNFRILGTTSLVVIPLMFLIKKVSRGKEREWDIDGCGGQ